MPGFGNSSFAAGPGMGAQADTAPSGGAPMSQWGGLWRGKSNVMDLQNSLMRAQRQCAQGSGSACQLAQQLQQRLAMAQSEQQSAIGLASQPRGAGSMGINGRGGRGRGNPDSYAAGMLQHMYGTPYGGGGGMGSF